MVSDNNLGEATPRTYGPANAVDVDLETIVAYLEWRHGISPMRGTTRLSRATSNLFASLSERYEHTQSQTEHRFLLIGNGVLEPARHLVEFGVDLTCIEPTSAQADAGIEQVPEAVWTSRKLFDYVDTTQLYDACVVWLLPNFAPPYLLVELFTAWKHLVKDNGRLVIAAISSPHPNTTWSGIDLEGVEVATHMTYLNVLPQDCMRAVTESAGLEVRCRTVEPLEATQAGNAGQYLEVIEIARSEAEQYSGSAWPKGSDASRLFDVEHLREYSDLLERAIERSLRSGVNEVAERVNRSIALDVLAAANATDAPLFRVYAERLHQSLFIPVDSESNFEVWWSLGSLFHKTGEYEYAVRCLDRACAIQPTDYRPFLRRGYCLEALLQFGEAIESALKARDLLDESNLDQNTKAQELAEICHALGHFYAGASHIGRIEPDETDFSCGLTYMIKACASADVGLDYVSCVGSMFSEREQYQLALLWFDWAEKRLPTTPEDSRTQEVEFYRAVALLGSGRYDDAVRVLETLEAWAVRAGDWDAKCHGVLYRVKAHIASLGLSGFDGAILRRLLADLEGSPPSRYVVGGVRRDRAAFIEYLRGAAFLDDATSGRLLSMEHPRQALHHAIVHLARAIDIVGARLCPVTIYSADPEHDLVRQLLEPLSKQNITYRMVRLPLTSPPTSHSGVSILVADSRWAGSSSSSEISWTLGALSVSCGGIILWRPEAGSGNLAEAALQTPFLSTLEEVTESAIAIALFRSCLEHFAYFETSLGLAPIGGAPSRLATQAGAVEFINSTSRSSW